MFNWEISWCVEVIDNSTDSQIRFNCQYESDVSASGFLKVVSLVWSTAICRTLQALWWHRYFLFYFCHQIFTYQWPTHTETTDHQWGFWLWLQSGLLALILHPPWSSGAGRGSCKSSPPYWYMLTTVEYQYFRMFIGSVCIGVCDQSFWEDFHSCKEALQRLTGVLVLGSTGPKRGSEDRKPGCSEPWVRCPIWTRHRKSRAVVMSFVVNLGVLRSPYGNVCT